MPVETANPNPPSSEGERHSHRQIDREIREMVSALTSRLTNLNHVHKPGSNHELGDEDEHGVRIITLAGTNTGAIMRGQLLGDHRKHDHHQHDQLTPDDVDGDELAGSDNYVNSNYQAVNNSVMLGASYTSNDPGVHMDIADVVGPIKHRVDRDVRKGMRKGKEPVHGNPHSEYSE